MLRSSVSVNAQNVAKVGNTEYATIDDAIANCTNGETLTLLANLNMSDILTINKAITFDGNGKTLTSTAGRAINVSGADGVTIKDLTINASGERAINVINGATNVIVENVTATAANYTVNLAGSATAAVVAIKNSTLNGLCTVNVAAAGSQVTVDNSTVNCNDNNTTTGESYAALSLNKEAVGGSIVATNSTINVTEGSDSMKGRNGAENGTVTINGSTEGVTVMVAAITYSGSNYYHAFATIADAIEFAKAGNTITLIRDVTTSEIIVLNKAITHDGNGKTLTSTAAGTNARAINVSGADGVTIKNLTIDAKGERAINVIQNATNVTIDKVTATAANYSVNVAASAPNAVVAISGSNLTGLNVVNVGAPGSEITINGGTITCNDQNEAEEYAALALNKDAVGAKIAATGVTFDIKGDSKKANNGAEGGVITIDGKTDEVVVDVAYIKSESNYYYAYTSIEAAIEAAKAGETIVLLRDVTVAEKITIAKSITLDGNGKTLTYTGNGTSARAIDVPAADGVKLEVTIKNLTVDCTASYCQRGINYNDDGALTLNKVTVKGTNVTYALNLPGSSDNAQVTITNSDLSGNIALNVWGENSIINAENTTFTAVDNNPEEGYAAVMLNNDGTTSAEGSVITITGGKIDVTGSACTDTEATSNGTSTGKINISDSTVVNGVNAEMVAVIRYADGNSYSFMTIEDAIEFAKAGETVTLLRDVTTSEILVLDKAITLDLNGKKVTSTAKKAFEVYANATIKNGAIEAAQRCVDTRKAVELTLTNVTLIADEYTTHGNPQPLTIGGSDNGTEVTMENVEINAGTTGYGIITFVETELTATNSTIGGYNALYVKPGSDNSVFNFVDSDLSGSTVDNDVEGNSFSVIAVRANNVTVNVDTASTVTAAGNYSYAISFKSKSDIDTPATGSSVTVAGTITGNILADLNGNTVKVKAEYADELAAAGYATIEAENGLVAAIKAVAKIGETYYATLAKAFAAAKAGETVTVLENVTLDDALVVEEGMDVTVSGEGKTITGCDGKDVFYVKGGKLTLTEGLNVHATTDCAIYLRGGDVFTAANLTKSGDKYSVIQGNGNYAGNVTITGGKVEASDNLTAIYWPQNGKLTITGGEIKGYSAVYIASGSLEITGGKLHGVGANGSYEGVTGGSTNAPGEALTIENVGGNSGYEEISSVVISGGEFISDYTKAVGSYANTTQNPEAKPVAGFISGGTFSSALEASYCAEGYGPYALENGTFGVESLNVDDITIVDGAETEFVNQNEKTVGTLTYKRSNIKNTWTPFYVPFAVPVSALADKFDVAYINDVRRTDSDDDGELDKFSMEIIYIHGGNANGSAKTLKANYPYFIRSKSGVAEMEITLTDATLYAAKENVFDCTTMTEKFEIKGNYHQIPSDELTENDYVVGGGEWHPLADGYSLNPFRFYMTKSSRFEDEPAAPMQSMRIIVCGEEDENGATIIYDVVEDSLNNNGNDFIYDLQGRRVSEPKKGGIYIKNGKKILF